MNVVIVGRPNVGKSSLFNRLLGRKRALVLDTPGVTRDRILETAEWWNEGKKIQIHLIDTGGLGEGQFQSEIERQVETALLDADVVLFVMDIRAGVTSGDQEVFSLLRQKGVFKKRPVLGVLNKADHDSLDEAAYEFFQMGFDQCLLVSAEHDIGIEDLKDWVFEKRKELLKTKKELENAQRASFGLEAQDENEDEDAEAEEVDLATHQDLTNPFERRIPRIAIVGQPNVGKSTMLNTICGEKRSIVSPIAGTTVDAIDTELEWRGKKLCFIDTAGIRRKNKTEAGIEVLSVVQSKKTLERADLALLMIDGEKGVYDQDEKIAGLIEESGASVILVINKWDTQRENDEFSQRKAEEMLREKVRFLNYAPVVFTTATEGFGLERLFRMIEKVLEERVLKLTSRELTDFIRAEAEIHNPGNVKFYFCHQAGRHPPSFVGHVSDPTKIHYSLSRHLVNAIRSRWGYLGTPIRFHFTKSKNQSEKNLV